LESLKFNGKGFAHQFISRWNRFEIYAPVEPQPTRSLQEILVSLKGLKKFKLEAHEWREVLPFNAILQMGTRLQTLMLRGIYGDNQAIGRPNALLFSELEALQRFCPDLTSLELNIGLCSPEVRILICLHSCSPWAND